MATKPLASAISSPVILVSRGNGAVVIPSPSPLTRLHYFDGKFLRAEDLSKEQTYFRRLVEYSNQAGGSGVVHGFDLSLGSNGDALRIGPGLAIDPGGRVLLLPEDFSIPVADLIEQSRRAVETANRTAAAAGSARFKECEQATAAPPVSVAPLNDLYLITAGHAEALCGNEDVFGKLCEEACVTATDRPFYVEGVVFRATPLVLTAPLPTSSSVSLTRAHLRSRVASAYYAGEAARLATLISGSGLRSDAWCLGSDAAGGTAVPLGVVSRSGSTTQFLDAWTARRERMDTPPRRYWAWRMSMRPWDVFLAQILQFQCQLHDLTARGTTPGPVDPCQGAGRLVTEASDAIGRFTQFFEQSTALFAQLQLPANRTPVLDGGLSALTDLRRRAVDAGAALNQTLTQRFLINAGLVELPSAGYLPVVPEAALTVNEQVRRWMGEGVDLRFCVVRPDFVAHALEEAQHLERISLLQGLDDPRAKPQVDILVPNGIMERAAEQAADSFAVDGSVDGELLFGMKDANGAGLKIELQGAARVETPERGAVSLHLAAGDTRPGAVIAGAAARVTPFLWLSASVSRNPFDGDPSPVLVELEVRAVGARVADVRLNGRFNYRRGQLPGQITGLLTGQLSSGEPANNNTTTRAVRIPVTATLGAASLSVSFDLEGTQLVLGFARPLAAGPLRFTAALASDNVNRALGALSLKPDAAVARPDNPLHTLALRALAAIEKATRDADFVETASPRLFPPQPPASAEALVRATLPWVLFHRRRTKRCEPEKAVFTAPESRCYRVFHLRNQAAGGALIAIDEIRRALLADDTNFFTQRGLVFQSVDNVEFQAGLPGLETDPAAIRKDWAGAQAGPNLAYAAIASRPAARAEGETLALARVESLSKTLLAAKVVDTSRMTVGPDEIDRVPSLFETMCSDGVIALVTEGTAVVNPLTGVMATNPVRITQPSPNSALGTATLQVTGGAAGRALRTNLQFFLDADLTNPDANPPQLLIDGVPATPTLSQRVNPRSWVFAGVNVAEPGPAAVRVLTIRNLIGDARSSGSTTPSAGVTLFLSSTGAAVIPITNPSGLIATVDRTPPFTLTAAGPSPVPTLRAQGAAEQVGEAVLQSSGGSPGTSVTANLQAILNANISATATAPPMLMIEGLPAPLPGRIQAVNTILFADVRLNVPPASGAPLNLRILNVRVDANTIQNGPDVVMSISAAGGDPVSIVNPNVTVGRLASEPPVRNGRVFVTQLDAAGARAMVALPSAITLQFQPDSTLRRPLTDAQARGITTARDRVGPITQVEFATREARPDAEAQKRLAVVLDDLRTRGLLTANIRTAVVTLSAADRAILPASADPLDDFIFLRLSAVV